MYLILLLVQFYYDFTHSTVEDALRPIPRYGKPDTLGMDAGPEITICEELGRYDNGAVVVTEEIGTGGRQFHEPFRPADPETFRTVFISDPTDRSNQLKEFLTKFPKSAKIGEIMADPKSTLIWEAEFSGPSSISGATSAISCVRRGLPIFSVIVNYLTQHMVVSCAAGNMIVKLPSERSHTVDLNYVLEHGKDITFPDIGQDFSNMPKFVTFLGDTGKTGYLNNFNDSGLMDPTKVAEHLHYGLPGGPSRILYLSNLQPTEAPVGFILANGEKIGEWIHWLAFVRFAKSMTDQSQPALIMNEVHQERPHTKEGILMATPPNYSIFREYNGKMYIDTSYLLRMPNPSRQRETLIVAPADNRWASRVSSQALYRSIKF